MRTSFEAIQRTEAFSRGDIAKILWHISEHLCPLLPASVSLLGPSWTWRTMLAMDMSACAGMHAQHGFHRSVW